MNLSLKYQNETFLQNQEWSGILIAKHGAIHIEYMYIRVPWSCRAGLGQIGFWWVDCGEPKYVLIFAITDNTVQRAAQLFIVLVKSKM